MEFVRHVHSQLSPMISQVIDSLDEQTQVLEISFFTMRLIQLNQMREDVDLMQLFFELSTTAFQGFTFSPSQAQLIDTLLATSEDIAFTMSVPATDGH